MGVGSVVSRASAFALLFLTTITMSTVMAISTPKNKSTSKSSGKLIIAIAIIVKTPCLGRPISACWKKENHPLLVILEAVLLIKDKKHFVYRFFEIGTPSIKNKIFQNVRPI